MKILSIDAWTEDEPKTWIWNNWYTVGEIDKETFENLKTDKQLAVWLHENGYSTSSDLRIIDIEDDGYNIVFKVKKTQQPVFAIEYGPDYL